LRHEAASIANAPGAAELKRSKRRHY